MAKGDLYVETTDTGESKFTAKILKITREYVILPIPAEDSAEAMAKAETIAKVRDTNLPKKGWQFEDESYEVDYVLEAAVTLKEWMRE